MRQHWSYGMVYSQSMTCIVQLSQGVSLLSVLLLTKMSPLTYLDGCGKLLDNDDYKVGKKRQCKTC